MSSYLTDAGELTRRYELATRGSHHRTHHAVDRPARPGARRRDQLAVRLRRVAARLEQ